MATQAPAELKIRLAKLGDCAICGKICYDAFATLSAKHGFPADFPNPEASTEVITSLFSARGFYCVVAECDGRIVGSNCLDERAMIGGIGPITVDPSSQNAGVGRRLMQAVMERARERCPAGMRLVQAAYHNRSLSLYANLGFDVREPLSCVQGRTRERVIAGCAARRAGMNDLLACNELSRRVHGFDRGEDLAHSITENTAMVVERAGRITGYASALAYWGHATGETNPDLEALLASAESYGGAGVLVPSRNHDLLRWCLANGLKVTQPLTLMSIGLYNEPAGAWLPSVMF
ncbi:MAG TPA: GNAT family N-acetyltransferase [Verrucomicrobiae bacterium]|nr:GNAT family N-acetyltransferase [Verrucomicrobiae bacterium]